MYTLKVTYFDAVPSLWNEYNDCVSIFGFQQSVDYAEYLLKECLNISKIIIFDGTTGEVLWES